MTAPAQDYTGLASRVWHALTIDHDPGDIALIRRRLNAFAPRQQLHVLDVGCGTGRTMRPLLEDGHTVSGVDVSSDQLEHCRASLAGLHEQLQLHCGSVVDLSLPTRFDAAIVPCGTLQLLDGPAEVVTALTRIRDHLKPGGLLLATFYMEGASIFDAPDDVGRWIPRGRPVADGEHTLVKHARIRSVDWPSQRVTLDLRYRRLGDGDDEARIVEEQIVSVVEYWYGPNEMSLMLGATGFSRIRLTGRYDDRPIEAGDRTFVVEARRDGNG